MKTGLKLLCAGLTLILLGACSEGGYYLQAARGHLGILAKRQPINKLLAEEQLSAIQKERLARILRIRDFASRTLALPDNGSYRSFVELSRPYPLWNLVAAPEFSLKARTWCFPIAGCVAYRGYFDEDDARRHAAQLEEQHFDTLVAGVPAYSTLSWFDDPVLSSFSDWPETDVARLIFHELAHQQLYLAGDSDFSEAFASSVERAGAQLWLERYGNPEQRQAFTRQLAREADFIDWAERLQQKLRRLYATPMPAEQMRAEKERIINLARTDYFRLKKNWGGFAGYDHWVTTLNNARLASLQTYYRLLPAFSALLDQQGFDFSRYYASCREISRLDKAERNQRLTELAQPPALAQELPK